jgi:hypothetical protein
MYPHPPFEPEQFALCYRAYAAALLDIQSDTGGTKEVPPADGTCLMVALRIIEASANGVRDPSQLRRLALNDLLSGASAVDAR